MAASSKSSQTVKNLVITLLVLWSIISLIIIVVWATSPDWKGSAQCRAELQGVTEKMEGAKVVWNKNKVALEELVEKEREVQAQQKAEILLLLGHLNATNASLEECRQENVVLTMNISVLQETIEQLRLTEANLTAELSLQEAHMDILQLNLTQALLQTNSCFSIRDAVHSQMLAAQIETKACEANQQHLQKQLQKCKAKPEAAQQTPQQDRPPISNNNKNSAPSTLAAVPVLLLLVCSSLHLITCEYRRHLCPNTLTVTGLRI